MRLFFSDEVLFTSALGGHHVSLVTPVSLRAQIFRRRHHVSWGSPRLTTVLPCKLGKARSLQSEAAQRSLPDVRLNLRGLRVRDGDEGLEVRWGRRDSQFDVNPVYYVFGHSSYLRCYDAHTISWVF